MTLDPWTARHLTRENGWGDDAVAWLARGASADDMPDVFDAGTLKDLAFDVFDASTHPQAPDAANTRALYERVWDIYLNERDRENEANRERAADRAYNNTLDH